MINILEFDPVITVFPYALLYFALLLVSSGLALLLLNRSESANRAALQTALVIIFISQIALLTLNLLAYQGFQLIKALFPLTHRVLSLVCLLWLIWSLFKSRDLAFPNWIPIILTVVFLIVGVVFSLWWLPNAATTDLNNNWMDKSLVALNLSLILASAIYYYARFRSRLVEAWLILVIAAVGFVLYLLLPSPGNMPAIVMLSQLFYYPLLISLVNRTFQQTQPDVALSQTLQEQNGQLRANIADAFLEISLQPSQDQLEKALTHSLSLYLMADLLGLVLYEPGMSHALLKNTYDLIREDHLEKLELDTDQMPRMFEKLVQGDSLVSNQESEFTFEKHYLRQAIGYNQIGNLLLYPLDAAPDQPRLAFLGLSPYTNKQWGLVDIQRLDRLRNNISRVLEKASQLDQEANQIGNLQSELIKKESEVSFLSSTFADSQAELQSLKNDLLQTQAAWTTEVNLWIERQRELEIELDGLQQTLQENQRSMAEVEALRLQKAQLEETIARNLEQTAQLKTAIDQASLLLQTLTTQDEINDQAEESKG